MTITQQYALDLYRAARRGEPAPPAPGREDWRTLRELREYRAARPAARPSAGLRERLAGLLRRRGSAVRRGDLPDPVQEGGGRGHDVVGRPVQCG
ncbi:hypothetical protein [Streptomyces cucumeris]|uniref:hypothetical protein n=1 Tax=Streptomyces cucumeris TaxID=2962890 RepID=UPI0020C9195F|nr:hypothetical protein [Streptomyces sp. NEAU-Y11]MCP9206982.1 hypothetical protein [Streptomyces sp. NEAU-Y11]